MKVQKVISIAVTCLVLVSGRAQASREEVLVTLTNCNAGCDSTASTCSAGCCGVLFCGKRCIGGCNTQETQCKEGCSLSAIGGTSTSAFFDTAVISRDGRLVRLGGPLFCPESATADIDVTVTQSAGSAAGTGHARLRCPGDETSFTADVNAAGGNAFQAPGTAQACGTAWIHAGTTGLAAFQWCREITLLPENVQLEE